MTIKTIWDIQDILEHYLKDYGMRYVGHKIINNNIYLLTIWKAHFNIPHVICVLRSGKATFLSF